MLQPYIESATALSDFKLRPIIISESEVAFSMKGCHT